MSGEHGPDVSLNDFIRSVADLRGTKVMCHEGGCGACIVAVRASFPPTNELKTFSVNSVSILYRTCTFLFTNLNLKDEVTVHVNISTCFKIPKLILNFLIPLLVEEVRQICSGFSD